MVEVFDNLYTSIKGRSRAKSFLRFTVRILANIILPIYLSGQKIFKQSRKINRHALLSDEKIIVSMTTFPKRIKKLWMVIETMRRQTVQPDKIVLWLSEEQFPNKVNDIPNSLQWYVNIGFLEIKFVSGDLRSHKKYYYSFQEFSNDIIIIIDDDIFYKKTLIAELMNAYIANDKGCVCAHRGYDVTRSSTSIEPYKNWIKSSAFNIPSSAIFHTSGGGTLYKAEFFDKRVLDYNVFKDICFHADDIWLNVMLQLKGTKTVLISSPSVLLPVLYKNDVTLSSVNVSLNKNDEQLKLLFQHYNIKENEVFNM